MPRLSAQRLLLFSAAAALVLLTLLSASRYDGSTGTAPELPPEMTLPPQGTPSTATATAADRTATPPFEVEDEAGWEDACGGGAAVSTTPPTTPVLKPADPVAGVGFDTVPVLPSPPEERGGGAAAGATTHETRYVAGPGHTAPLCYSELTNVCVAGGVLTLSVDPAVAGLRGRGGGLLSLCNEGAAKGNHLHVRVAASAAEDPARTRRPAFSGKRLYVLHCWQYYGYHLWQCLLGVWARFQRAGRGGAEEWWGAKGVLPDAQYALTFGMPRHGATDDAAGMFRRSPGGLAGADEPFAPKAENAYFPLFRLLSPRAADFARLSDLQTPRCYATAYAGSPNPYQATAEEWRGFVLHAKGMLRAGVAASGRAAALTALVAARGGDEHPARAATRSPQLVVTIVQRKHSYRMLNVAHVLEAGRTLPLYYSSGEEGQTGRQEQPPALRTEAAVVSWEDMPVLAQVAAAARTNVLVGVHGNGLTWLVFMPNAVFTTAAAAAAAAAAKPRRVHRLHSAVVELWPSAEYKGDYKRMARMAGVHYLAVQHGAHETRSDVRVNLPLLRGALVRAARRILEGCGVGGGGGAAASAAASSEAAGAGGVWEAVYGLVRQQKSGYARRGVLKKHYKPVALRVALVGGWTDVLNRAHFELCGARDVRLRRFCTSFRDADADLRLRRRACVEDASLPAQAVASCLVSIDVLLLGRQQPQQNGTGGGGSALTEATWRVPAMVAEQQAREVAVAAAQHAQAKEEKLRAAGTWDSTGQAGGQRPVVILENPWLISDHNT